ncbi:MAG TPA: VTT domain-containing protein [Ignavibacteria bacterium]
MEFFKDLYNIVTEKDFLKNLIMWGGYIGMFIIVYSETGLLLGFFLPGDSMLVTAGLLAATPVSSTTPDVHYLNIVYLILILIPASILGDNTGYFIGHKAGPKLFKKEQSLLFRKDYLIKTHEFYEKYGGIAIILAKFMPFVRTFVATVAGVGQMSYWKFFRFNMIGAVTWIPSMTLLGYFLGRSIPDIDKHIEKVILGIIFLSLLPLIFKFLKHKLTKTKSKTEV